MRNAGRLKLGYYPLPIEEAQNIQALLVPSGPYAAIDPCVGDGTALIEITKERGAHLSGIELDADRAAAAAEKGIATVHGSAFECRVTVALPRLRTFWHGCHRHSSGLTAQSLCAQSATPAMLHGR